LIPRSQLSKTLVNSYRTAHYRVTGPNGSFVLIVKKPSEPLASLMKLHGAESALFITAENPHGQKSQAGLNQRAQKALQGEIKAMGFPFWEGVGEDPTGNWKSERSFLALGVSQEQAEALGEKYRQNAVIWADGDAVPRLILLR
jgi:hypothetical protein